MKKIALTFFLITTAFLYNCIGEYIREDAIAEEIRFLNPIERIATSESYQLNIRFFNNIGEEEAADIYWSSDNTDIAIVSSTGLITGLSEGFVQITAQTMVHNKTVKNTIPLTVTPEPTGSSMEEIIIINPIDNIRVSETHQYAVNYYNSLGELEETPFTWSSSNPTVATVNSSGLVRGISEGITIIKVRTTVNSLVLESSTTLEITENGPVENSKSGLIMTTSSYTLKGSFTLSKIDDSNNLELYINSDYEASTSLPGLYIYLSNNPNSIGSAFEIGAVTTFSGAHTYTINNKGINDYSYVLYWCKPFGVKVGDGQIKD